MLICFNFNINVVFGKNAAGFMTIAFLEQVAADLSTNN